MNTVKLAFYNSKYFYEICLYLHYHYTTTSFKVNTSITKLVSRASKTKWSNNFLQKVDTTWWRLHHKKASFQQCPNHQLPQVFTSPNCIFCNESDLIKFFFWECSYKQLVWRAIPTRFLLYPTDLDINYTLSLTASLTIRPGFMLNFEDITDTTYSLTYTVHTLTMCISSRKVLAKWRQCQSTKAILHLRKMHAEQEYKRQQLC
ncbi:hypothetical protein BDA99DRAFT_584286 [Phascolomyces articulosus]|uniref:Reverse transcriptase zinc-binding domain-containing protein n=1 Tax=Phascolomyces articulosus TaxID=60185 RepID=A0AAD5KPH1_9FUNG|nr:hypothetical protein BDA99DRAFT_584286 [Phascolomyces articulosus]